MLSYLLYTLTGMQMFNDRLFRGGAAAMLAATLIFVLMPWWIRFLKKQDASADFAQGETPPIMGGVLIVFAVLVSGFFFSRINGYSASILLILFAYSAVGVIDDWFKVRAKKAVALGQLQKQSYQNKADGISSRLRLWLYFAFSITIASFAYYYVPSIDGSLTIPFIRPDLWHPVLPAWLFILMMSFITTATANGTNFTDGIDTLVSVPLITTALFAAVVAYVSGNAVFAKYLLLPHLPGVDEVMPIAAAIVGACLAYLWYNAPPAQIYMGDGGSIGLGGAIGMMFIFVKAELFLPIVGFVFLIEAASSFMQIGYFKFTKKRRADGIGQRLFLRAPLHEHYKLKWKGAYPNGFALQSKLMWRFHLVSIFALIIGTLIFFKVR